MVDDARPAVTGGADATVQPSERARLEADVRLKEQELELRQIELTQKLKAEQRGFWLSPLLLGVASAMFGILGTGVGAILQGYWDSQLERQKFESTLILDALKAPTETEKAKGLLFLVGSGLVSGLNGPEIEKQAATPAQLPSFLFQRVDNQIERIQHLSPDQALKLMRIMEQRLDEADPALRQLLEIRDPQRSRAKDGDVAKQLLLMWRALDRSTDNKLTDWEKAISDVE